MKGELDDGLVLEIAGEMNAWIRALLKSERRPQKNLKGTMHVGVAVSSCKRRGSRKL